MKTRSNAVRALAACSILLGGAAVAAENKGMEGMKDMKDMPAATKPAGKQIMGMGVVKSVDAAKGTVTISHDPIKELNWPAMTMGFKVADPALLKSATVGKKVEFALEDRGGPTIVAIK